MCLYYFLWQPFFSNRFFLLFCLVVCLAMDTSHHAIQYHLARALMHLNHLASFLPSFEIPADWGSNPAIPRSYPHNSAYQLSRQLHRFVPLPTDSRPPPSLASHGDLPPHFVMNPEPHLQPTLTENPILLRTASIGRSPSFLSLHMRISTWWRTIPMNTTVRLLMQNKPLGPPLHEQLCIPRILTALALHPFGLQSDLALHQWLNPSTALALPLVKELPQTPPHPSCHSRLGGPSSNCSPHILRGRL